jgi:hypothetical protein
MNTPNLWLNIGKLFDPPQVKEPEQAEKPKEKKEPKAKKAIRRKHGKDSKI